MNPYEPPQAPLNHESGPRKPLNKLQNAGLDFLWIVCRALVLFGVIFTGLLLADRAAVALGFTSDPKTNHLDAKLPYLGLIFIGCSWQLWRLRGPRSRRS